MSKDRELKDNGQIADQAALQLSQRVQRFLEELREMRQRVKSLLDAKQLDLDQLRILLDDLQYASEDLTGRDGERWKTRLESLSRTEISIRDEITKLKQVLERIDGFIQVISLADTIEDNTDSGFKDAFTLMRVLQGQEMERSRLAREVHDGPAQVMANAIMAIEYCERLLERRPQSLPSELHRIKLSLRQGLEEVRRFIYDLRPSDLTREGIIATLRKYAEDYQQQGIEVSIDIDEAIDKLTNDEQKFALFRIIQEAMQNSRKHASASEVRIQGRIVRDESVELLIADNGRGFDPEDRSERGEHYGLRNMKERAEALQGTLDIKSSIDDGTVIRVVFPISKVLAARY